MTKLYNAHVDAAEEAKQKKIRSYATYEKHLNDSIHRKINKTLNMLYDG